MKKEKKKILKRIALIFLGILIVIQFFRIDTTNPAVDLKKDFIQVAAAPDDVSGILKTSCYDCHSNTTKYPWYSQIAPMSWMLKNHIDEGREHLNFSVWSEYSSKKADHNLEECIEMVQEGEMPLSSYTLIHGDAKLSGDQKNTLVKFFKSLRTERGHGESHDD